MAIRLRQERRDREITQLDLAKRVNLTRQAISQLESGRRKGSLDTWDRIEAALGIPQQTLRQPDPDGGR